MKRSAFLSRVAGMAAVVCLMLALTGSNHLAGMPDRTIALPASVDIHSTARTQYLQYDRDGIAASVAMYEQLLREDMGDATAHAGLANALMQTYLHSGRNESVAQRAFDAASTAIELDHELPAGHKALGAFFHFRGEHELALPHYAQAVELDPGYWNALNNGAEILRDLGEYAAARNLFSCALQESSRKTDVLLRLADVEARDGRPEAAAGYLEIVRLLEPSNEDIASISERIDTYLPGDAARHVAFDLQPPTAELIAEFETFRCPTAPDFAA